MGAFTPPPIAALQPEGAFTPPPLSALQDEKPGSQPASLSGVASVMTDQAKRALGAAWETIGGVAHLFTTNPATTAKNAFAYTSDAIGRVKNAASSGDYEGAARGLLGSIPLVGPQAEQILGEIRDGKYAEAIGHAGALRALAEAPEAIGKLPGAAASISNTAGDVADALGRAAKAGGKDVATGAAKVAGGAALGYAAGKIGIPGMGEYLAAAPLVTSGMKQIGRGAKAAFQAARTAPEEATAAEATPTEAPTPAPISRQLPAGAIPMPAAEDTSGITVSAAQKHVYRDPKTGRMTIFYSSEPSAGAPVYDTTPTAAPPAPVAAAPAPLPRADTMDPAVARTLEEGARRVNPDGSVQVLKRVPLDQIEGDSRIDALTGEHVGNEIDLEKVAALQAKLKANDPPPHAELRANPDGGYTIQDGHHRLLAGSREGDMSPLVWTPEGAAASAPAAAAPSPPAAIAPPAEAPPARAPDFEVKARAAKVSALADTLHNAEIAPEAAARMTPGDWNRLSDALGINRPSAKSITATIEELRNREAGEDLNRTTDNILAAARAKARPAPQAENPAKVAAAVEAFKSKPTLASARAAAQVGQVITTKRGKTGGVTKVNPNGTFVYQPIGGGSE